MGGAAMNDDREFDAVQHDGGGERVLGVVTMAGDGRMSIVSAGGADAGSETLETVVGELNRESTLHVPMAPPAGARQFEVFTGVVERGSGEFVPAMLAFLRKYHDIELRAR